MVKRTRNMSAVTKENTVKTTGNGQMNSGELIMPRTRNGRGKDFVEKKTNRNRTEYHMFWGLGPGTKALRKCKWKRV